MTSPMDFEQAASRLRNQLQRAQLPELKLLCGLNFFSRFESTSAPGLESYLREFISVLVLSASKCNPHEFLPEEAASLSKFISLLKEHLSVTTQNDIILFEQLHEKITTAKYPPAILDSSLKGRIRIACLFVEYYPDLDMEPRGRLLNLYVTAGRISSKADADDTVVRNPIEEPDDRFLSQARDSIKAARTYLFERYGLPLKKKYRFDFAVDSTGARFTGDSLGVAFAVGAIAALSKIEVFPEKISIPADVAFTGALDADGNLMPIDADALKLKIYRAFHSDIKYLIIPREHITDGWQYISDLEKKYPDNKLEIVGLGDLKTVVSDSRLLDIKKLAYPSYLMRRAAKASRSTWVEIPAILVLLAILFFLIAPAQWMPWFDDNPGYAVFNPELDQLEVYNHERQLLWLKQFDGNIIDTSGSYLYDLHNDGRNEVFCMPTLGDSCKIRNHVLCYSADGELLLDLNCAISNEYPRDSGYVLHTPGGILFPDLPDRQVIISILLNEVPARSHICLWDENGKMLGWYIHSGHSRYMYSKDLDGDNIKELIFSGINNRMGCASLFALKIDSAMGVSPPYEDPIHDLTWVKRGNQYAYTIFPTTELGKIATTNGYNSGSPLGVYETVENMLQFPVVEGQICEDAYYFILYYLDYNLRVKKAVQSDPFKKFWNSYVKKGLLDSVEWGEFQAYLRDTVTYWSDSGWVTEAQLRAAEGIE